MYEVHGLVATPSLGSATGSAPFYESTIRWTSDGSNWSNAVTGGFDGSNGFALAWNGDVVHPFFVATGWSLIHPTSSIQWSIDGSNWTPAESGGFADNNFQSGVVYNPERRNWTAVGSSGTGNGQGVIFESPDGKNWQPVLRNEFYGYGNAITYYPHGGFTTFVTSTTVVTQSLTASSVSTTTVAASTINGVPYGQGYTDATTFQYNYVDPVLGFQAGVSLSNESTIGYILHRPYAPITYFNLIYSGSNNGDVYAFYLSTAVISYNPYYFSTATAGTPDFIEQLIVPISTPTTQVLPIFLSVATGLTLYSATIGHN